MQGSEIPVPEEDIEGGDNNFVRYTSHSLETSLNRDSLIVPPKVECHIRAEHGMDAATYRREVLRRSLAEWPVDIPAQVLRTRLHAYKTSLNDASFAVSHCALCARQKRVCKLGSSSATCMAWIHGKRVVGENDFERRRVHGGRVLVP